MTLRPWLYLSALLAAACPTVGAEVPKAPVPVSPFIRVVYGYADTLLKNGRDDHGPEKNGLFLSALDRTTLAPLTNRPAAPTGLPLHQRVGATAGSLAGSNPHHDQNLFRLLYALSDLTAKPHYRQAADSALKWWMERSPNLLLSGNKSRSWDVLTDTWAGRNETELDSRTLFRPWMLWDRCFELNPVAATGLALTNVAGTSSEKIGSQIRFWSVAFSRTRDQQFNRAIEQALTRQEKSAARDGPSISMAIDYHGGSANLLEPLASRLRILADREDDRFCSLRHDLKNHKGFRVSGGAGERFTPLWSATAAGRTTAQVGMLCVSRYDNTGKVIYRDLIFAAADAYLNSLPAEEEDTWPMTFGHAISLELAAWRHSANWKYMERARKLGEIALEKFWGTNALPRASLKTDHYESITGADTLALALLELHLQVLHITAVRCPPNTIDR